MPKSQLKRNKVFIAYYRLFNEKQSIGGLAIEAQKQAVKDYLKRKYPPASSFAEIEKSRKKSRPELMKALALCKKEKACLVVPKLGRLSRDFQFLNSIEKAKIDFVFCDYPGLDRDQLRFMGKLAKWESEQMSKWAKDTFAELKKKGKKLGWYNPKVRAGLKAFWKVNKKLTKEKRAKLKKLKAQAKSKADLFAESMEKPLRELKKKGLSHKQIAKRLQTMRIKTRLGKARWGATQVARLIKKLKL